MSNRRFLLLTSLLLLGAAPVFVSCNAITGATDLRFTGDEEDDEGPADTLVNAAGLSITAIDLYQGVKRPLMANGAPVTGSTTSIVAGREALIRVWVSTSPDYDGLPVTGRLYIGEDKTPIEDTKVLAVAPTDDNLSSTINFTVPGEKMVAGMTYRVELKQQKGAPESKGGWRYPAEGDEAVEVLSDGATMKVVLVPIQYGADGSNRLPVTTPEQIQQYKDSFYGFYPIPTIDLSVRSEVMVWDAPVSPIDPYNWADLLDAVTGLRAKDNPADDVYYFGIFSPASNEGSYCSQGCIAGLAGLAGPGDEGLRAAIGLGFGGSISTETAVHEIGHTFGREHSPCGGADGPDPNYPYPKGNIGVWGYDLVTKQLYKPEMGDIMSYCSPSWISDYTFMKLFERFKIVNKAAKMQYPAEVLDRTYARIRIQAGGELVWRDPVKLHRPPVGHETKTVTVLTPTGPELVTGQYYPSDHIEGGVLLLPLPTAQTFTLKVDFKGQARTLTK